jgi:signal transduction histidine kinase
MRRLLDQRVLAAAGWGAAAATLAVGGLGLYLTLLQYGAVRGVLLDSHRRAAEARRPEMASFVTEAARRLLAGVRDGAEGRGEGLFGTARDEVVAEPFLFLADGSVTAPLKLKDPLRPPTRRDEPQPVEFAQALRRALLPLPFEARSEPLAALARTPELAAPWRLRAAAALAAITRKDGQPGRAAERYRALREEFRALLPEAAAPSSLQISIAHGECLLEAGRAEEARRVLLQALEEVRLGAVRASFDEERFLYLRARAVLAPAGAEPPAILHELEARQREERLSLVVIDTLRDWIFRPGPVSAEAREAGRPRYFFQEVSGRPVLAVWSWVEPASPESGPAVAGFRADLDRLEEELSTRLTDDDPASPLVVRAVRPGDGFTSLASLADDLWFLRIGLSREAWSGLIGPARLPFLLAGVLIAVLTLVLLGGFVAFFRGVRREILLSQLKTEFVANVSHELKTPLALIRLFGETLLLGRVTDPERRTRYYEIITRESERLSQLISNVLNFSSIEAGKTTYRLSSCDLSKVLRETIESYRFHLEEKGFTSRVEIADSLPPVAADPDAVAQALINLLQNAMKYSRDEKEVTLRASSEDGSVRVSVEDRGIGIPAHEQPLIWQDYYRTREARALGTRGSGLGLSVVQHIMRAHGGAVALESEPGRGSVFTLVFPTSPSASPGDAPASEGPEGGRAEGERPESGNPVKAEPGDGAQHHEDGETEQ